MEMSAAALTAQFSRLSPPWRQAFTLAWESFRAGDLGIGAVVVDPSGTVVATGRNRRHDRSNPPGEVAGNNLAHADWTAVLPLLTYPERFVRGPIVDDYRSELPELMALADRVVNSGQLSKLRELSLTEAWEVVGEIAT